MTITFPGDPTVGTRYSNADNTRTWEWNGIGWQIVTGAFVWNITDSVDQAVLYDLLTVTETDAITYPDTTTFLDYVGPSFLLLTGSSSDADSSSYSTASITPKPYSHLLVCAVSTHATLDSPAITVSGTTGASWSEEINVLFGAASTPFPARMSVWVGTMGSAPGTGTLTIAATNSTSMKWLVYEVIAAADNPVATPLMATAQSVSNLGNGTTGTVTLAAAASPKNRFIAFFSHLANEATTPRTNWIEDTGADVTTTAPVGALEGQVDTRHNSTDLTPSATWTTSSRWGAIAIEINSEAI